MVKVDFPIDGCSYTTGEVPETVCVALLNTHALQHATTTPTTVPRLSGPKLVRPMVSNGITLEEWNMFRRRWEVFADGSGILVNGAYDPTAAHQLFQCADDSLGDASSCGLFSVADYTDHAMREVLVAGIYDPDIRRDVLGVEGITAKPINDVVSLVEGREMARNALVMSGSTSAISRDQENSSRRAQHKNFRPPPGLTPCPGNKDQRDPCLQCGQQFTRFTDGKRGWNTKPSVLCKSCFRKKQNKGRSNQNQAPLVGTSVSGICEDSESIDIVSQISAVSYQSVSKSEFLLHCQCAIRITNLLASAS